MNRLDKCALDTITKAEKQRLSDWLATTMLGVVMRKGGLPGLVVLDYDRKPEQNFTSFREYEDWAIGHITNYKKVFHKFLRSDSSTGLIELDFGLLTENSEYQEAMTELEYTLFPFMSSDKHMYNDHMCDAMAQLDSIIGEIINRQVNSLKPLD